MSHYKHIIYSSLTRKFLAARQRITSLFLYISLQEQDQLHESGKRVNLTKVKCNVTRYFAWCCGWCSLFCAQYHVPFGSKSKNMLLFPRSKQIPFLTVLFYSFYGCNCWLLWSSHNQLTPGVTWMIARDSHSCKYV